jgi:hypothetical protein
VGHRRGWRFSEQAIDTALAAADGVIRTSFTQLVGVSVPIQLAAMPGISTPELVAAVADAGGLGMLGGTLMPASVLEEALEQLSARTGGVFGVNFLIPFVDETCVSVAARRARVVEFFYGEPDARLIASARARRAATCAERRAFCRCSHAFSTRRASPSWRLAASAAHAAWQPSSPAAAERRASGRASLRQRSRERIRAT